ncbi:aldehyde dehydrogenase family protein [Paraburkholderia dipogonis]|uniref:Aldehyde dehydrogenase family protein n=1 Tax=Paraburkholderia dipogonis TaxID=1211383 RepID=A0A4Y8MK52_9BURK|nr:aldehyde dehydrogenase family protein [Paraburkholderia dipogonis]
MRLSFRAIAQTPVSLLSIAHLLSEPTLLPSQAFIDDQWVDACKGESFDVSDPVTGVVIAAALWMGEVETRQVIHAAHDVWPARRQMTARERGSVLKKWGEVRLSNIDVRMAVVGEETFGPLAPFFRFSPKEEIVARANGTEYGLAVYFFSRDVARVWRVAEALKYGMVGINTELPSNEPGPFGGVKQSGISREGSHYGMGDYTVIDHWRLGGL